MPLGRVTVGAAAGGGVTGAELPPPPLKAAGEENYVCGKPAVGDVLLRGHGGSFWHTH